MTINANVSLILNCSAIILSALILAVLFLNNVKDRWWLVGGSLIAFAAGLSVFFFLKPENLNTGLITILHEGSEIRTIEYLFGLNAHAGKNFTWLMYTFFHNTPLPRLLHIIHFNISITLINCILFFILAKGILKSNLMATALGILFLGNFMTFLSAFSEGPSALVTLYFWISTLAIIGINIALSCALYRYKKTCITLSTLLLGVITFLIFYTRPECALFGIFALFTVILRLFFGDKKLNMISEKFLKFLIKPSRKIIYIPPGIIAICVYILIWRGVTHIIPDVPNFSFEINCLTNTANLLDLSFLSKLPDSPFASFPVGILFLVVLGIIYSFRHWLTFSLLPVSCLILYKIYFLASHNAFFELLRFMTMLYPAIMLLALLGFKSIEDYGKKKQLSSHTLNIFTLFLLVFMLIPTPPGKIFSPDIQKTDTIFGINKNLQKEARYLMGAIKRYPQCLFLVAVTQDDNGNKRGSDFKFFLFSQDHGLRLIYYKFSDIYDIAKNLSPDPGCILFYRGLDCNMDHGTRCLNFFTQSPLMEEYQFENQPYNDYEERGGYLNPIQLQLYKISHISQNTQPRNF